MRLIIFFLVLRFNFYVILFQTRTPRKGVDVTELPSFLDLAVVQRRSDEPSRRTHCRRLVDDEGGAAEVIRCGNA